MSLINTVTAAAKNRKQHLYSSSSS